MTVEDYLVVRQIYMHKRRLVFKLFIHWYLGFCQVFSSSFSMSLYHYSSIHEPPITTSFFLKIKIISQIASYLCIQSQTSGYLEKWMIRYFFTSYMEFLSVLTDCLLLTQMTIHSLTHQWYVILLS